MVGHSYPSSANSSSVPMKNVDDEEKEKKKIEILNNCEDIESKKFKIEDIEEEVEEKEEFVTYTDSSTFLKVCLYHKII